MRADAAPSTQALRGWQRRALVRYLAAQPRDSLTIATPGSGKTAFALRVASELLADGTVEKLTVVVPTEHLKTQWTLAAAAYGLALDPKFSNSAAQASAEYHRVVVTYAQVARLRLGCVRQEVGETGRSPAPVLPFRLPFCPMFLQLLQASLYPV